MSGTPCLLVPRSAERAALLVAALEGAGMAARVLPVLSIQGLDTPELRRLLMQPADVLIAVSRNAVAHAQALLPADWTPPERRLAVGPATAQAIADAGWGAAEMGEAATSEGLLAVPALAEGAGRRVLLLCGRGGRGLLADTLTQRGFEVLVAAVYHRAPMARDEAELAPALNTATAVLLPSVQAMEALLATTPESMRPQLLSLPLVAPSARVIQTAQSRGFAGATALADGLTPAAVVAAMASLQTNPGDAVTQDSDAITALPMSETDQPAPEPVRNDPPATPPATAAAPKTGRGFAALALFLTLINLLVLAAVLFLGWKLATPWLEGAVAKGESLNERVTRQALENERQDERLDRQAKDLQALGDGLAGARQQALAQQEGLGRVDARIDTTEAAMADVTQLVVGGKRSWQLNEIEHLLLIANDRLQLSGDLDGAIAALRLADERIALMNDPALLATRQAIANELAGLVATPRVDTQALALKIGSLSRQVPDLPLSRIAPTDFVAPELDDDPEISRAEAAAQAGKRALAKVKQALGQMVVVRQTDAPTRPLLPPSQEYFLRQNLLLKLETARLAVLQAEAAVFRDALQTARTWTLQNFDREDRGVQALSEELQALAGARVTQPRPDISGSLQAVRRVIAAQEQ